MKKQGLLLLTLAGFFVSNSRGAIPISTVAYDNRTIVPGYNLVGVQLRNETRTLGEILELAPEGATVWLFEDGELVETPAYSNLALNPGDAFLVHNPSAAAFTATFVGEVPQGTLVNPLPKGLSLTCSMVPMAGTLEEMQFEPRPGDQVFVFDAATGQYRLSMYLDFLGAWYPAPPVLDVGEAFFIRTSFPRDWVMEFNVNEVVER